MQLSEKNIEISKIMRREGKPSLHPKFYIKGRNQYEQETFWRWNCRDAYHVCGDSKSPLPLYFIKGDKLVLLLEIIDYSLHREEMRVPAVMTTLKNSMWCTNVEKIQYLWLKTSYYRYNQGFSITYNLWNDSTLYIASSPTRWTY